MLRAVRLVIGDRRIPRPLRLLGGLALLPVPGPFDEAVLLLIAVPLVVFYRGPLRDAWERSDTHVPAPVVPQPVEVAPDESGYR
jgi:hypothetical protein